MYSICLDSFTYVCTLCMCTHCDEAVTVPEDDQVTGNRKRHLGQLFFLFCFLFLFFLGLSPSFIKCGQSFT